MEKMKKLKLPVAMLLALCLVLSSISMAFASPPPVNEPQHIDLPVEDGGHLCYYDSYTHDVSVTESAGYAFNSGLLAGALMLFFPAETTLQTAANLLVGAGAGVIYGSNIQAGDRIVTSVTVTYSPSKDAYVIGSRTIVYRPTWSGSYNVVQNNYMTDEYYWYESSYDLYADVCPH
jgi:hypothetical protein